MIFRKGVRLQQLVIKVWCQASNHLKLIRKGNSLVLPRTCCCSVPQSCLTPVTPWLAVRRLSCPSHLPEFAQIQVHWVGDAIWPSHPTPPRPTKSKILEVGPAILFWQLARWFWFTLKFENYWIRFLCRIQNWMESTLLTVRHYIRIPCWLRW